MMFKCIVSILCKNNKYYYDEISRDGLSLNSEIETKTQQSTETFRTKSQKI